MRKRSKVFHRQLAVLCCGMTLAQYEYKIVSQQRQPGESFALLGERTDRQIQLAAIEQVGDVERTAGAEFESHPRSNLDDPSSQWTDQDNRRIVVHGDPKASRCFGGNKLCWLKRKLQTVKCRSDRQCKLLSP